MFEAITFSTQNKHDTDNPLDIGWLVECILFYERATVVANHSILKQLIRYFGVDNLLILIEEGLLHVLYTESNVGIITNTLNNVQYHDASEFSSPQHTYQDVLRRICIEVSGKAGKGRRLAQKIQDKIEVTKHDHIILEGARQSILDQQFIEPAARIIIKELVPEIGDESEISFRTYKDANGIQVSTNLNYSALNELYHQRIPPEHSSLSAAQILAHVLEAERELYFSSTRLSELASSTLSAKLAEQKLDYIIARSKRSGNVLSSFTKFLFNNAKAVREPWTLFTLIS